MPVGFAAKRKKVPVVMRVLQLLFLLLVFGLLTCVSHTSALATLQCSAADPCCTREYNFTEQINLKYGTALHLNGSNYTLLANVYIPVGAPMPMPVIIWVHGGAFYPVERLASSSKDTNTPAIESSRKWASKGFLTFSIEYRRWGNYSNARTINDPIFDVLTAVQYVTEHAAQWGADVRNIGIIGCSAGGVTATHANIFDMTPRVNFSFVISISGGALSNNASTAYTWPPAKPASAVRPQLSIVSREDTDAFNAYEREVATAAYFATLGVHHELILLSGDKHCPEFSALDAEGDTLFESMLTFALRHTQDVRCVHLHSCASVPTASHLTWFVNLAKKTVF
jgi:hypothetical protein